MADAKRLAELSGQLGYPATEKQMKERLREVIKDKETACFVAELREGELIGWIHVSTTPLLEVEPQPATRATRHTHRTQRRETFA